MAAASKSLFPTEIDTVIVGNGPSALILSYILHGNIPYYDAGNGHPDAILHQKLLNRPSLLDLDVGDLTAHFAASRLSYSTQALPVNVLLDTLIRPLADTNPGQYPSCVTWRREPEKRVAHLVLGNTSRVGGQWADNPIAGSWDIGALSYAEMLSLPGYSLIEHRRKRNGKCVEKFDRPTRREVAEYLAIYPEMVGISDSMHTNFQADGISRTPTGFHIASHGIRCKHLVLASGIFSHLIPARPLLQPLFLLNPAYCSSQPPLLVIGSGFTAADVILSSAPGHRVLHIFKWAPDAHPSPLRACHPRAYPEYASVYKKMKLAARACYEARENLPPTRRKGSNSTEHNNGQESYEGLPNTYITDVVMRDNSAIVTLRQSDGRCIEREVSAMQYVIGRRGSLNFIDHDLSGEILGPEKFVERAIISGKTLRARAEESLELAADVFVIGSLTGDSLIRFAFGGCVFAAGEIIRRAGQGDTLSADGFEKNSEPSHVLDTWAEETDKAESRKSEPVSVNS
ncbi:MAG: hypothetical protein Q9195_008464 [Heterodermia aff. obscurata]